MFSPTCVKEKANKTFVEEQVESATYVISTDGESSQWLGTAWESAGRWKAFGWERKFKEATAVSV